MLSRCATRALALGFVSFVACGEGSDHAVAASGSSGAEAMQESSTSGSDNELPTMEAVVDVATACAAADGAQTMSFVATRVGCVKPPPSPCTLPDPPRVYTGTTLDCSSTEDAATLQVAVDQTGRYHVETLLGLDDGSQVRECYVEGDEVEVIIDDGRLANRPTLVLTALGTACP